MCSTSYHTGEHCLWASAVEVGEDWWGDEVRVTCRSKWVLGCGEHTGFELCGTIQGLRRGCAQTSMVEKKVLMVVHCLFNDIFN